MSPTDKLGEELRRIFLSKDTLAHKRTQAEQTRDTIGAYAVGCLAASIFFSMMSIVGVHDFPDKVPLIGRALKIIANFAFPAYWVLLAYWVYLDAKIRGMNAAPWGLLCLAMNFIGLFTYLVVRNPDPIACGGCGRPLDPGARLCPFCGAMTERVCPSCGSPIGPDWQFCPSCASVIPKHIGTVQTSGPLYGTAAAQTPQPNQIDNEERLRDIPNIIEKARAVATSAEEAEAQVSAAVERIVSGEVFSARARIGGCVFDAERGRPLPGATVRSDSYASPLQTTTDASGMYAFVDLEPGPYVLIAEADGYYSATRSHSASGGQSITLDFRLVCEPAATMPE